MRREILIEGGAGEIRIALLEDDLLSELFIDRVRSQGASGNIYKGRVTSILPGMQSAFVDVGLERNAFLYVEDAPGGRGVVGLERDIAGTPPAAERPRIEDLLSVGQEILVQVSKDPVAQKGARITSHLALPGRFLVFLPGVEHIGVSRRIDEPEERDRLRALLTEVRDALRLPGGLIVRTVGKDRDREDFETDALSLRDTLTEIQRRAASSPAPAVLHEEAGALEKALRDVFQADVEQVLVDDPLIFERTLEHLRRMQPELAGRLHMHTGAALFEDRGVQRQIERALRPRVWLKSGGHIVINPTEALVAIDVNTGKFVGSRSLEETVLATNLEAVQEIVRQIRLRDLGGIIVVDFIDMEQESSRERVRETLQTELRKDRSRSRVLQISEFGLVEITRQRTRRSLERILCEPCPACRGSGRIKSAETLFYDIVRAARRLLVGRDCAALEVCVHPTLRAYMEESAERLLAAVGRPSLPISLRSDADLLPDQFTVEPQALLRP